MKTILAVLALLCLTSIASAEDVKWKEYWAYCASSVQELHTNVNYYMRPTNESNNAGWQPIGGISVVMTYTKGDPVRICQVLVR